jgi:hypothetical protein
MILLHRRLVSIKLMKDIICRAIEENIVAKLEGLGFVFLPLLYD